MAEWSVRPLDPMIFIDAIHVKVRDGQVTNRPIYVAIGVTVSGERDILGLWPVAVVRARSSGWPSSPSSSIGVSLMCASWCVTDCNGLPDAIAVGTVTPNEGGRCRHTHPLVSTNTIAVKIARSSTGALPPPCGRAAKRGINGFAVSHNAFAINRRDNSSTTRDILHNKSLQPHETHY
jgi:hypothetical protein